MTKLSKRQLLQIKGEIEASIAVLQAIGRDTTKQQAQLDEINQQLQQVEK